MFSRHRAFGQSRPELPSCAYACGVEEAEVAGHSNPAAAMSLAVPVAGAVLEQA